MFVGPLPLDLDPNFSVVRLWLPKAKHDRAESPYLFLPALASFPVPGGVMWGAHTTPSWRHLFPCAVCWKVLEAPTGPGRHTPPLARGSSPELIGPERTLLLFSPAAMSRNKPLEWQMALPGESPKNLFWHFHPIPRNFNSDFSTLRVVQHFCLVF